MGQLRAFKNGSQVDLSLHFYNHPLLDVSVFDVFIFTVHFLTLVLISATQINNKSWRLELSVNG